MDQVLQRLSTLVAADVMNREVVEIGSTERLSQAVSTLRQHAVTGAPVLDPEHRCIGVLSGADLVRWASLFFYALDGNSTSNHGELSLNPKVSDLLSPDLSAIPSETPLLEVAQRMCRSHVHRMVVVDHQGKIQGIVSTMDVVAALVNALAEAGLTDPA
ncbi:Hypothetical protein PBC10988_13100 [Planctomycetales bacterium 10988]|nr:Hypothetical protein PBC10988_13100 [Planctomycetales bacterium 10988]